MGLKYKDAKNLVARFAGRAGQCPTDAAIKDFLTLVLQQLLYSGSYGNLRKISLFAEKGMVTLPPEVETILKVKVDGCTGTVFNTWGEFSSSSTFNYNLCDDYESLMYEDPNYYPTAFDAPVKGSLLGVMGTCEEDCDAHVIIQGRDHSGTEIYTFYKGDQISGERLSIKKGITTYGVVNFAQITGVVKSVTTGYVQLYAVNPAQKAKQFLSAYSPNEEIPRYRRVRLKAGNTLGLHRIEMLVRIRLKENYSDEDILPFENHVTIVDTAQQRQAELNLDIQTAQYKKASVDDMIERENSYKTQEGDGLDVFWQTSAGAIKNVI